MFREGQIQFLFPLMEISSFLTGRRGVSIPFADYCQPIIKADLDLENFFPFLTDMGMKRKWKTLEFRGYSPFLPENSHSSFYYRHALKLTADETQLNSGLSKSTTRNIRKAEREQIEIEFSESLASLKTYFKLHCLTRKRHGLPPQPFSFFKKIYEHAFQRELGFTISAKYDNTTIASAIFLHVGNKAMYKYGASDMRFQNLRPNNLIMWEAIKYYASKGYAQLCFGRTDHDQEGLRRFKMGWGCEESQIFYYKYNVSRREFVANSDSISVREKQLFSLIPIFMSKAVGNLLYKHVG
jgi:lipid II:glycine glycyltransferase (peptidoglycan interpeptide bridge formation enzyme)